MLIETANVILAADKAGNRNGFLRGWVRDGVGPARFGWARVHPCKLEWVGTTWAAALATARD